MGHSLGPYIRVLRFTVQGLRWAVAACRVSGLRYMGFIGTALKGSGGPPVGGFSRGAIIRDSLVWRVLSLRRSMGLRVQGLGLRVRAWEVSKAIDFQSSSCDFAVPVVLLALTRS